ncbi:hypothetical protein PFISCL1PPCAC_20498, partial [Pristionchus fissidentatus]
SLLFSPLGAVASPAPPYLLSSFHSLYSNTVTTPTVMFRRMKQNLAEKVGKATVTTSLPAEADKGIKQVEIWRKRHGEMQRDYENCRRISNPNKHDDVANLLSKLGSNLAETAANTTKASELERACSKTEQKAAELIQKDWGQKMRDFDKVKFKEMQDCITGVNRTRLDKDGCASAAQSKDTPSRRERSTAADAAFAAQIEAAKALFATIPTLEAEQAAIILDAVNRHGAMYGEVQPPSK